jgi:hypothetical protein
MATDAAWCGQCYAPVAAAVPAAGAAVASAVGVPGGAVTGGRFASVADPQAPVRPPGWRPVLTLDDLPAPVRRTRWRKTQTTFGPIGRIVCTVGLVVPFVIMVVGGIVADPFALGGAFIWGGIITPWALRDIWRAGQLPSG